MDNSVNNITPPLGVGGEVVEEENEEEVVVVRGGD